MYYSYYMVFSFDAVPALMQVRFRCSSNLDATSICHNASYASVTPRVLALSGSAWANAPIVDHAKDFSRYSCL